MLLSKPLKMHWKFWCREGDSNPHALFKAADFKSAASASSAIPALSFILCYVREYPEKTYQEPFLTGAFSLGKTRTVDAQLQKAWPHCERNFSLPKRERG